MDRVMPEIAVIMTTCVREGKVGDLRAAYVEQAIASLHNLRYEGSMQLHFADDGSKHGFRPQLQRWGRDWEKVTFTNADEEGFGKSLNMAIDFVDCDLLFFMPDDWILEDVLDLTIPARILADENIGMVRTGMIHPDLYARSVYGGPELQYYWIIDKKQSGYACSFRTWLAHRRFFDIYGKIPEGQNVYETERIYNEKVRIMDGPEIAYAGNVQLNHPWKHIGDMACSGEPA